MKERYFFKNSRLFSDYYLKELLPKDPIWEIDVSEYFKKIKEIYERKKDVIESLNEPSLEDQFIRPILRVLGHKWEVQPSLKKYKKPDYSFYKTDEEKVKAELSKDYFGNAIAVGEVKRWERSLDRKFKSESDPFEVYAPSLQMERYLWRTEVKWGILTNGRFWRIYERKTSSKFDIYYEVDLINIFEKDDLEGFKYFYLFFRKDAFPNFLNKVYEESIDYAKAVGEDLKSNVYKALRILANGFLETPGNNLSIDNLQEIHNNSLIFLYRLLFILYAEAGGLLPLQNSIYRGSYSLDSIKKEIVKKIDKKESIPIHKTYWGKIRDLFKLINEGSKSYGISKNDFYVPPYNGGLFDPDKNKFLEENDVLDNFIVDVVDLLSRSTMKKEGGKAFVDYSSLDIRHLGSIYEGLLENKLKVAQEDMSAIKKGKKEIWIKTSELGNRKEIDNVSKGKLYPVTDKGERKATGSYYTPDYIVKYIVENTIGPLIEEKKRKKEIDLIDEILSLKILDPAMGSGHFLVEATDFIAKCLVQALGESPREVEEEDIRWARREVVEKCIYGVDLNPLAVELAKLSLWLSTISKDKPLSFLDHHLKCGNSLIGARIEDLAELPSIKSKKMKKMIGQISTYEILFNKKIEVLLNNRKLIEELPSEKVEQIREKEKYEEEFRKNIKRFKQIADLWTSIYFGNEISWENYITVQDKLESSEEEWQKIINEEWFERGLNIYKKKRFFHWELEFPEIFYIGEKKKENPGFDVVVGNPPWVSMKGKYKSGDWDESEINFYLSRYKGDSYRPNTIEFFSKLSLEVLRPNGFHSFIVPDRLTENKQYQNFREFILIENTIRALLFRVPFPKIIADTLIYVIQKRKQKDYDILLSDYLSISQPVKCSSKIFLSISDFALFYIDDSTKMNLILKLLEMEPKLSPGIAKTNTGFIAAKNTITSQRIDQEQQAVLKGENVSKYQISGEFYFNFTKKNLIGGTQNIDILSKKKKILVNKTGDTISAMYVESGIFPEQSLYQIWNIKKPISPKYILTILNSKLIDLLYKTVLVTNRDTIPQLKKVDLDRIPIRCIYFTTLYKKHKKLFTEVKQLFKAYLKSDNLNHILSFIQQRLLEKPEESDVIHDFLVFLAEIMIKTNQRRNKEAKAFLSWLEQEIDVKVDDLLGRTIIKNYHEHSMDELIKQLNKNRKKLQIDPSNRNFQQKLSVEFSKSVNKVNMIKEKIRKIDYLIDQIVYRLYGISEEEIKMVKKELN